jgi:hypothetical protein
MPESFHQVPKKGEEEPLPSAVRDQGLDHVSSEDATANDPIQQLSLTADKE